MLSPNKRKIPHQIRGGTIRELADMYSNPLAFVRETGSNAYDQGAHPDAAGRPVHLKYYIHRLRRRIEIDRRPLLQAPGTSIRCWS